MHIHFHFAAPRGQAKSFRRSVWALRITTPLMVCLCFVIGYLAFERHLYFVAAVDAFLGGVNLVLAYIQWFIFRLGD